MRSLSASILGRLLNAKSFLISEWRMLSRDEECRALSAVIRVVENDLPILSMP